MDAPATFETPRERVSVSVTDVVPRTKGTHVFAMCVSSDGRPIVAARRTSFAFQEVMLQRRTPDTVLRVPKTVLRYMYSNELREIASRSRYRGLQTRNDQFVELIMLGGRLTKSETAEGCLEREIREESDGTLTVRGFGRGVVLVRIFDKALGRLFEGYCMLCFVEETLAEAVSASLYNVEVRGLRALEDDPANDKFAYLMFIYNILFSLK
ncbi:MutT motif protein [Squirrelpox virus]|uniref:MutT motif protein n=1 Tax=Squirrelpox virus TaxID=240426 RepID=U3UBD3_9POXV|nr:MutT motif protein [Squirrelpox virus]CCD83263.1 MutT motif protein [Squirrelpox virus]